MPRLPELTIDAPPPATRKQIETNGFCLLKQAGGRREDRGK